MFDPLFLSIISTLVFLTIFVYLPGTIIGRSLKLYDWWDMHCAVGVSILMLILFFGRFLLPTSVILIIYIFLVVILGIKNKNTLKFKFPHPNIIIVSALLLGTLVMAWSFIQTALNGKQAIIFEAYRSRDQSWHLALISELTQHFPPQVPGFSGEILKNYHYFMDLLISANYAIFGGDIVYYFQLIYPVIFAFFFGVSIYRLITFFTNKTWIKVFTIMLAYLGNNLSYLLQIWGFKDWQSDTFFLDQPAVYLGNIQTVFSLALFFYLIILLVASLKKPRHYTYTIAASIILATLIKVKIYAFVIGAFLFGVWGIWQIFLYLRERNIVRLKLLSLTFLTAISLSGAIYLLSFNSGKEFIVWEPGWLMQVFYERVLYTYWLWFKHHYMVYKVAGNPKYYLLSMMVIILYILLNLGTRIIGLISLKYHQNREYIIMLFGTVVLVFSILLLTRQSAGGYNIIQFGPYAVTAMSILTGVYIAKNNLHLVINITLALILFVLSIPVTIKTLYNYQQSDYRYLNTDLVSVLTRLRSYPDGVVATFGVPLIIDKGMGEAGQNLIGAIGYHRSFLSDKTQIEVLDYDWKERAETLKQIEQKWCEFTPVEAKLIKEQKIAYFLVSNLKNCGGNEQIEFKNIAQAGQYAILKVK